MTDTMWQKKVYFEALKVLFTLVRLVDTEEKVYLYFLVVMGWELQEYIFHVKLKFFKTVCEK